MFIFQNIFIYQIFAGFLELRIKHLKLIYLQGVIARNYNIKDAACPTNVERIIAATVKVSQDSLPHIDTKIYQAGTYVVTEDGIEDFKAHGLILPVLNDLDAIESAADFMLHHIQSSAMTGNEVVDFQSSVCRDI